VIWASGLFDGEGCFTRGSNGYVRQDGTQKFYPVAKLGMNDRDSVERFRAAMGFGTIHSRRGGRHWTWSAGGFERFQATVGLLWTGLSARRRERALSLLKDGHDGACWPREI